jgi:hypothetical protein
MGRPSKYTDAIADTICSRLSNGESLAQICREDEFPSQQTVYSWFTGHYIPDEKYEKKIQGFIKLYTPK